MNAGRNVEIHLLFDSGGIKSHEQSSMERSARCVDKLRYFVLAENRGQAMSFFRMGSVRNADGSFSVWIEPPHTQMVRHGTLRQLPLCQEVGWRLP